MTPENRSQIRYIVAPLSLYRDNTKWVLAFIPVGDTHGLVGQLYFLNPTGEELTA
jgi:hypothetical protein